MCCVKLYEYLSISVKRSKIILDTLPCCRGEKENPVKTASRHNVMHFTLQKIALRPPCIDVDGKIGCIENPSHSIALWLTVCMRSQLVRLQTIFFQSLFLFLSLSPRRSRKINKEKKRRKFVIFFPCTKKQSPSNIVELKQK